jgi:O-antigen/teichoic acid export membrane protein
MISTRRKFVSNTVAYTVARLLLLLRALIVLPLFARMESAESYGIFIQITVTMGLLVPLVSLRLDTAAVRFLAAEEDKRLFRQRFYTALLTVTVSGLFVGLLLALFASVNAELIMGDPIYSSFMALSGLLLAVSVIDSYLKNYFRIIQRIQTLSVILLVESGLETALILLVVYRGYGVMGAILVMIGVRFAVILGLVVVIGQSVGRIEFEWHGLREMLAYSVPLIPNGIMLWAVNYADRIIIIQLMGAAAIGVYSAAYSLGMLPSLLIMPLGFVLFPFLSNLWDKGEVDEVKQYLIYVTRYYLFLALPACVGLAMMSKYLIRNLASVEFATDTPLVLWIALGYMLNGLFQINAYVFHLIRKTKYVTVILLVSASFNIILNLTLVPVFGLSGAAFATAFTFLIMTVIALRFGRQLIGYRISWQDIAKSMLAAALMAAFLYWIPIGDSWLNILGVATLGAAVYFFFLIIFRALSKAELLQIRRIMFSYLPG